MTEDKRSIIQMVAGLIEQGKKNQDKIAYSKILDTFSGVEISSEQFDNILKVLEDNKIEVLRSKNDMEQTVSLSAKEKEPDEVDDEELEESKILLDIDDDIEEDSEENIEEDLSVMEGADNIGIFRFFVRSSGQNGVLCFGCILFLGIFCIFYTSFLIPDAKDQQQNQTKKNADACFLIHIITF